MGRGEKCAGIFVEDYRVLNLWKAIRVQIIYPDLSCQEDIQHL